MVYRVIDDDTALSIYDAVQKYSSRELKSNSKLEPLPKHKIAGEVAYYLNELLAFAETEMAQTPAETLAEVIDAGTMSWFGALDPALQSKLGIHLTPAGGTNDVREGDDENDDAVARLTEENRILAAELAELKETESSLRRDVSRLEIEKDELIERLPSDDAARISLQPAYLGNEDFQSSYTEMTSHVLSGGNGQSKSAKQPKKSKQSRRRR